MVDLFVGLSGRKPVLRLLPVRNATACSISSKKLNAFASGKSSEATTPYLQERKKEAFCSHHYSNWGSCVLPRLSAVKNNTPARKDSLCLKGQSTTSEDQPISIMSWADFLTSRPGPRLHRISGDTQYIAEGLLRKRPNQWVSSQDKDEARGRASS